MSRAKMKLFSLLMMISFLCNGCFTPKLWEMTDPKLYVQIKYTEITEDELKAKGIKYEKDDKTQSFYVEKDSAHKFKDYTYRALGTPITVALDAGSIVFIVIAYMIADNEVDKAKERGKEAEATRHGYRSDVSPLPQ